MEADDGAAKTAGPPHPFASSKALCEYSQCLVLDQLDWRCHATTNRCSCALPGIDDHHASIATEEWLEAASSALAPWFRLQDKKACADPTAYFRLAGKQAGYRGTTIASMDDLPGLYHTLTGY